MLDLKADRITVGIGGPMSPCNAASASTPYLSVPARESRASSIVACSSTMRLLRLRTGFMSSADRVIMPSFMKSSLNFFFG